MEQLPAVSCMCLTYGRPHLLEEAIQSFLLQDYAGSKELIVLNDCEAQHLEFQHPEVHVVNVSRRFRTVGEKRNTCAALAAHDLLFVWDDDDIFLPHRISYSVKMFEEKKRFFKPSKAFSLSEGKLSGPKSNLFHSGSCFSKQLFDEAHGYCHMGSGQDMELELTFERIIGREKNYNGIQPEEIYYLYRWGGTGSFHLSGFGRDKPGKESGNQKAAKYVEKQIAERRVPIGAVKLTPHWRINYSELVRDYIQSLTQSGEGTQSGSVTPGE
jgi:glycosyltransferase involved in cell wall biosynthesis